MTRPRSEPAHEFLMYGKPWLAYRCRLAAARQASAAAADREPPARVP